ncbi:uncharacterized protein LOC123263863 [Cotesia glomerata]|uniref:uncharacterized protein LOC123263863 n=1 Tax=Cotesia glomerata TaxID=32391 RepID=UPI001D02E2D4|nr:uncharacterized protein LOC123263863 [Cotesia glomerata]
MSENPDSVAKDLVEVIMINVDNSIPSPDETLSARNSNTSISEILQKVAEMAEGLCTDLEGVQIGDYVVSMYKSPLEIQVKQAIENFKTEAAKGVIKGQGDGVENIPLPAENLPTPASPIAPEGPSAVEGDMSTLKRKKNLSLARRVWRSLRFTFSRRKN